MADERTQSGPNEPRSYNEARQNRSVDLNSASREELMTLPMVDERRAKDIMQRRPFRSWEEVNRIPGFGEGMLHDLRNGGATIGTGQSH